MKIRDNKGSITVFVLVALLFMTGFLIISFGNNVNKSKSAKEQLEIINSIYEMKVLDANEVYNKNKAIPVITIKKSVITNGVMGILIEANDIIEKAEYKIDDKVFNSQKEFYQYVNNNVKDNTEKKLTIIITNDAENTTKVIEKVKFVRPQIGILSTQIIINSTSVQTSYVTYDEAGKKEEKYTIVALNKTFDTMTEVVNYMNTWMLNNNKYEIETNIKITAKGNNNLNEELTQRVKFVRGIS